MRRMSPFSSHGYKHFNERNKTSELLYRAVTAQDTSRYVFFFDLPNRLNALFFLSFSGLEDALARPTIGAGALSGSSGGPLSRKKDARSFVLLDWLRLSDVRATIFGRGALPAEMEVLVNWVPGGFGRLPFDRAELMELA